MNLRSLPVRLVTLSALLTGLVVLAFGAWTYRSLEHYSREVVETVLQHRAEGIGHAILARVGESGETEVGAEIERLYAPELNDRLVRISRGDGTVIFLSGEPMDHSFHPAEIGRPPGGLLTAARGASRVERTASGAPMLIVSLPWPTSGGPYLIETGTSLVPNGAILHGLALTLAAGLPVVLGLAVMGAWLLVRGALRPVQQIVEAAQEISLHHLSRRLPMPPTGDDLERLTRALNEMIARLDEAFQHTGRFTADASHELRTPLTIMRGELEALLTRPGLPPAMAGELGSLLEETVRLTRTVEGLFSLSRLDAGEARAERARLDLAALVATTVEQMCLLAEEKHIALQCETKVPVEVEGDRARLRQVVVNLLDNAIKYTPAGGRVTLRVEAREGHAVFSVEDSGPGVAPVDLPHVFERFFRAAAVRAGETSGAGLGLAIVQAICAAHSGSVALTNLSPSGCRAAVTLPRAR